jgi:hypothetical protein
VKEKFNVTRVCRFSLIVLACGLMFADTIAYAAQQDGAGDKRMSTVELRARIAALEQQLADQQRDYAVLLKAAHPSQPPPLPAPADEQVERARAAAQQRATEEADRTLEAANERAYLEQQRRLEDASWYVQDLDFGVTERNNTYARFAWKATVKNGTPRAQIYDIEVQFLDSRDLIVDTAHLYREVIAAQDQQVLRGDRLISMPAALNVTKIHAVAKRRPEER